MRMKDIPIGHVARSPHGSVALKGHDGALWLNGPSSMFFSEMYVFADNYEDLGPLDYVVGLQKSTGQAVRFESALEAAVSSTKLACEKTNAAIASNDAVEWSECAVNLAYLRTGVD